MSFIVKNKHSIGNLHKTAMSQNESIYDVVPSSPLRADVIKDAHQPWNTRTGRFWTEAVQSEENARSSHQEKLQRDIARHRSVIARSTRPISATFLEKGAGLKNFKGCFRRRAATPSADGKCDNSIARSPRFSKLNPDK